MHPKAWKCRQSRPRMSTLGPAGVTGHQTVWRSHSPLHLALQAFQVFREAPGLCQEVSSLLCPQQIPSCLHPFHQPIEEPSHFHSHPFSFTHIFEDSFPSLRLDYKTWIRKCQNLRNHPINSLFYSEAEQIRKQSTYM